MISYSVLVHCQIASPLWQFFFTLTPLCCSAKPVPPVQSTWGLNSCVSVMSLVTVVFQFSFLSCETEFLFRTLQLSPGQRDYAHLSGNRDFTSHALFGTFTISPSFQTIAAICVAPTKSVVC